MRTKYWRRPWFIAASLLVLAIAGQRAFPPAPKPPNYGPYLAEIQARVGAELDRDDTRTVEDAVHQAIHGMLKGGFGYARDYRDLIVYYEPDRAVWLGEAAERNGAVILLVPKQSVVRGQIGYAALGTSGGVELLNEDSLKEHMARLRKLVFVEPD